MSQAVLFELIDGRGVPVSVTSSTWNHIKLNHREMTEEAVRLAVGDPDMVIRPANRRRGRHIDRRANLRLGAHARYNNLYVAAFLDYGGPENRLVTAYLSPRPPKGDLLFVRFPIERP
jgi:hypothetical protein